MCLLGCTGSGKGTPTDDSGGGGSDAICVSDDDDEPAKAVALSGDTTGFLCPTGDQDWYQVDISAAQGLLDVNLAVDAPVTAIDPTYDVWDATGANVMAGPESSEAASATGALHLVHGLAGGTYLLQIRDRASDAADDRHPYLLTVTTSADPDTHEPNNQATDGTPAATGNYEGFIASRGDSDWYAVTTPDRGLVHAVLEMPVTTLEPTVRIEDDRGNVLAERTYAEARVTPTVIDATFATPSAGSWYVVVADDNGMDWDTSQPYELTLDVGQDPDPNEPNDSSALATDGGSRSCGASWSTTGISGGYIAANGDTDWLRVNLSGCTTGILDGTLTFSGTLPKGFTPSVRIVRASGDSCAEDQECTSLDIACSQDIDCATLGNECLGTGVCAGGGSCLDNDECAATLLNVPGEEGQNVVHFSAPIWSWDTLYVVVSEQGGDVLAADNAYDLTVNVRSDPDSFEPNNQYPGGPPDDAYSNEHLAYAKEVPVHDCTLGDCCDSGTWVEGQIGYAFDEDWYIYQHPCPGEDCMVRVTYDDDAGAVDDYYRVLIYGSTWFDTLAPVSDVGNSPAQSGSYGGLGASDECFYAYSGHDGDPFYYAIAVRDTVFVSSSDPEGGSWDWDSDQSYRFCVEKIADTCETPCKDYGKGYGCGLP